MDFLPKAPQSTQVPVATHFKNCVARSRISDVACLAGDVKIHVNARPHTAAATQNFITTFGWEQFDHPPCSPDFLHLKSKKPLPLALHRKRDHSTMKGYKNWCNAMTSASTMVDTMSKSSVRCVHQMAIYMVCNVFFYFNSPSELTFWITYIC